MTDDADNNPVTAEDLAAAQARWADPAHEPDVPELFARPIVANGVRGDVVIAPPKPEGAT